MVQQPGGKTQPIGTQAQRGSSGRCAGIGTRFACHRRTGTLPAGLCGAACRGGRGPAIYTPLTRDISMFTAGYSSARDVLGQAQAFPLYRQMFLDTGAMEMNWLWPSAELLATLKNPAMGGLAYWRAFLRSYQADGVLTFVERERDDGSLLFSLSHCLYARLFAELGCPELSPLIRDMEHAALLEMSRNSGLRIDWQTGEAGYATVKIAWPSHALSQEVARLSRQQVSQKCDG